MKTHFIRLTNENNIKLHEIKKDLKLTNINDTINKIIEIWKVDSDE